MRVKKVMQMLVDEQTMATFESIIIIFLVYFMKRHECFDVAITLYKHTFESVASLCRRTVEDVRVVSYTVVECKRCIFQR